MQEKLEAALEIFTQLSPVDQNEVIALAAALASPQ
jgi:hypothetical protein